MLNDSLNLRNHYSIQDRILYKLTKGFWDEIEYILYHLNLIEVDKNDVNKVLGQ